MKKYQIKIQDQLVSEFDSIEEARTELVIHKGAHIQYTQEAIDQVNQENIYKHKGYENRQDYLKSLADDYGIDMDTVLTMANLLGPIEDFDGLVSELQDYTNYL